HGWIQVGRVLEEVEDPAWAVDWLQSNWPTPSHRSRTALHPEARRVAPSEIKRVWVREDDVTLLVEGIHGVGRLLREPLIEEHEEEVVLTALVGWWPDIADQLDRAEGI